jgi:hypothetical protein
MSTGRGGGRTLVDAMNREPDRRKTTPGMMASRAYPKGGKVRSSSIDDPVRFGDHRP